MNRIQRGIITFFPNYAPSEVEFPGSQESPNRFSKFDREHAFTS